MATQTQLPRMGFYRDTNDTVSHLANGWTAIAMCGLAPTMRTIGWTIGTDSGLNITAVCPECQNEYREFAQSLAAINANRC